MTIVQSVIDILEEILQLGNRANDLTPGSPLLGAIPEFDSMAVVSVITALEDHYGIIVDDDDLDASAFETVGSLTAFVEEKITE